jgi:hypothetical protein
VIATRNADTASLTAYREDRFRGECEFVNEVSFERGADGKVKAMPLSPGRSNALRFEKKE